MLVCDYALKEFELWTSPDCSDTEYETTYRTWFYFGVSGGERGDFISFTMMNLNKQSKLYNNDFRPVFWSKGMDQWQRVRMPCIHSVRHVLFHISSRPLGNDQS